MPSKRKPAGRTPAPPSDAAPSGPAAAGAQELALIERVGVMNRIQAALRSTLNVDDIHSIILSTLVSREGFNFSRSFIFCHEPEHARLRGHLALGADRREVHDRLDREVKLEQETLARMVRDLSGLESRSAEEELIFSRSLHDLSRHAFWITTHQIYQGDGSLADAVRKLEVPYTERGAGAKDNQASVLRKALSGAGATVVTRRQLEDEGLPAALLALFPGDSLWAPLRTQKGLRMAVVVDKLFQEERLNALDALHMDWFAGQAASGLEIAEIHRDLEEAYHALRELDRMKSNFLATVSHELRTPLTAINGYLQLLLGNKIGPISQGKREILERVMEHSELLTGKVNDLIEIAELDMDVGEEAKLEEVDPLAALIAVMPRVDSRRTRKQIAFDPAVEGAIPRIKAAAPALERILFHLLDNAIKFGKQGGRVRIEFAERPGELAISVSDDGIGISANQLQSIFGAFYQVDNRLTRNYEGMGIGLTVIKRQLDRTGGRVEVQSEPGRGSTFTVVYPLAD